ncbi:hypothetical protein ATANTOWER_026907 [Ataeniobius toweri]|uniref:Uncharacterized protein n=1 Tax=Ataeniobius toweri TaxID=208326 RepID=A0ABU7A336_9TELE|nr:hypothetical protein [Ataeniobius toweri]
MASLNRPEFLPLPQPGLWHIGHLRTPTSQPQPIKLLQLDAVPYCRCPPPGLGIAVATGTTDLMPTATGGSINNRYGEHSPLGLYVSSLPWNLVKALLEVKVEYIPGRGFHQTLPADPHHSLEPAKSVQLPPLQADQTHHHVVSCGQLSPSFHPCVQGMRLKVQRHDYKVDHQLTA